MPSLVSGNSVSIGLDGQDFVTVTNADVYHPTGKTTVTTATVFGPYSGGGVVRIVSTGSCTYTVSEAAAADVSTLEANYTLKASDDGKRFYATAALTITVPSGLSPQPEVFIDCPASGNVTVASDGTALLNGATTSLTRARSANAIGFAISPHQGASSSYGVSGA